ncbi:hypothetical protein [Pseudomonas reactans]|uniref:hypothetical protein n=1 Tax=Pseudomonas reactans TaxID=117680 RepID=UPI0021087BCC|nr:hypothetical protein [Pseudomonas reactans]
MAWYKTGTVSVTANSNAVIGTGTAFIANARVGDAFRGPDGLWYEVTNIASNTALSIAPNYQGATVAAGVYTIAPMQGYVKESADRLRAITDQFKDLDQEVADAQASAAAAKISESKAKGYEASSSSSANAASSSENSAALSKNAADLSETNSRLSAADAVTQANRAQAQADRAKTEADKLGNANAFLATVDSISGTVPRFKDAVQVGGTGGVSLRREGITDPNSTALVRLTHSTDSSVRLIDDARGIVRLLLDATGSAQIAGNLTVSAGNIYVRAASATTNAHLWFNEPGSTTTRGVIYCEPNGNLNFAAGYGQAGSGSIVTVTKSGQLRAYQGVYTAANVYLSPGGDIVGPGWSGGSLAAHIGQMTSQLSSKLDSSAADFAIIYPNGGTAASPGNIVTASRFTSDNPFPGFHVITVLEILIGGIWSEPRLDGNAGTGGASYGAYAQQILPTDKIICQAGASGVALPSASAGGGHGYSGAVLTTAPVRVKVWKLKGAI